MRPNHKGSQATAAGLQRRLARAASRLIKIRGQRPGILSRQSPRHCRPGHGQALLASPGPQQGFEFTRPGLAREATCLRLHWSRPGVSLRATRPKATGVARLPSHLLSPRPGLRDLSLRVTRLQAAGPLGRQAPGQESGPLPGFTRLAPQRVGREGAREGSCG